MNQKRTEKNENAVGSVLKAIQILDCFTPDHPNLNLSQISKNLDIPKSTALNLIQTLESQGFLLRMKSGNNYQLGYKNMELGYRATTSLSILPYAIPIMEEVQEKTGEIIYLTTHINGRVFYLQCSYPSRPKVSYSVRGKMLPMHCTGCGKAMLTYLSHEFVQNVIDKHGLRAVTPNTITDPDRLFEELEITRQRGYARDFEEETIGVRCVGVAIRNTKGQAVGALSLSGSVLTMTDENADKFANLLSNACNLLSQQANLFPASQMDQV